MFGMSILDTAIGLVFVYLLLSLACTAINEWIAGLLNRRPGNLFEGLKTLLWDPRMSTLLSQFYSHPLVQDLHVAGRKPAYIEPRTFSLVFLDLLSPSDPNAPRTIDSIRKAVAALPEDSTTRKTVSILLDESQDNLTRLEQNIEGWFNGAMDRVSGWYKQRTQVIVLAIAAALVLIANADTIQIASALANNSALREALVAQAKAYAEVNKTGPETGAVQPEEVGKNIGEIRKLGIPLGWRAAPADLGDWLNKLAGLGLSAFAVSLGAPFWFDLLNRFMTIRAGGKSPNEKPKPPETSKAA